MAATNRRKRKGRLTPLRIGLVLLTVALGAALLRQRSSAPVDVGLPEGLAGTWTTDDPRYSERALRLTTDGITFSTSADESTTYPIVRVEREPGDDSRRYTIRFQVEEQLQQLSLLFDEDPGEVRLENQPHIEWRQQAAPD